MRAKIIDIVRPEAVPCAALMEKVLISMKRVVPNINRSQMGGKDVNTQRNFITVLTYVALTLASFGRAHASPINIGVYSENAGAEAAGGAIVTAQSNTFTALANLSAGSLAGMDMVWYMNQSNSAQAQASNAAAIAAFAAGGGVFLMNDREVSVAETILPGGGAFNIIRQITGGTDIDVLDGSTTLTNGPGGIINDTTLDGGNFSSHGFTMAGTLPGMADLILSRMNDTEIVDFTYMFGAGAVHYSSIPLDFYMTGGGANANFLSVYAPNLVSYGHDTWHQKNDIPEPATLALFGLGLAGLGFARRKKA